MLEDRKNMVSVASFYATTTMPSGSNSKPAAKKRKRSASPAAPIRKMPPPMPSDPKPLQPSPLLLTLPQVLAVPPNHEDYLASLAVSFNATRQLQAMKDLAPEAECRGCTAMAEIGLRILQSRECQEEGWLKGVTKDVERAIGKGLLLAQKQPSLEVYKHTLTLLQSQFMHLQRNLKYARFLLKRTTSSLSIPTPNTISFSTSCTPSWFIYTAHLTAITQALASSPPDLPFVFGEIQELLNISQSLDDPHVALLSHVLRLRTLVDAGMWDMVHDSLELAESALGLSYQTPTPKPKTKSKDSTESAPLAENFVAFDDPFEACMVLHVLIMGVVYFTHIADAAGASPRLSHLHALLDAEAHKKFADGVLLIKLSSGPPLYLQSTHPRLLYHMGFLVTATAKRDPVGRKPRRKVFATKGLQEWERTMKEPILLPVAASLRDVDTVEDRMAKIKADIISELAGLAIMRSEFDFAEDHLASLTAHTRTHNIFSSYAARITLHYAHLAHAIGQTARALDCYQAAAHLSTNGTFVNVSARAGEISLRIGLGELDIMIGKDSEKGKASSRWVEEAKEVIEMCHGMGGTLEAVGHVLESCLCSEIITAKQHLKSALQLATSSQDNHLRALILALIASLYFRTSPDHAKAMLETCGQLAVGLGAPAVKPEKGALQTGGNMQLALWVGEKFLELYNLSGDVKKAAKQEFTNKHFRSAVEKLQNRTPIYMES